jgi:hypothetical protein
MAHPPQMFFSSAFMLGTRGLHHMQYHLIHDENDHEIGHCGIAWAAQRWILDKHKLYDRMIIGGGDNLMFQVSRTSPDSTWLRAANPTYR